MIKYNTLVSRWLFGVATLIFIMVVVGGVTRLTGSGLSMTDWRPVTGTIPPLTYAGWLLEFTKYKASPEYQLVNAGMSLGEFKNIFYWEWGHRLLGRLIGLAFALPLGFFWVKGYIPSAYKSRLLILLLLGGAQGLLGWYMVKSGLVDMPSVSHYRLVAHLSLALLLFSAVFWIALSMARDNIMIKQPAVHLSVSSFSTGQYRNILFWLKATIFVLAGQIVMGGLVAGLDAGHIANDWPTMAGQMIPAGLLDLTPLWTNFIDNHVTVHFDHRIGGYIFLVLVVIVATKCSRLSARVKFYSVMLITLTSLQILLGIITVITMVPVHFGALHQAGGVLVLAALINLVHKVRWDHAQSLPQNLASPGLSRAAL